MVVIHTFFARVDIFRYSFKGRHFQTFANTQTQRGIICDIANIENRDNTNAENRDAIVSVIEGAVGMCAVGMCAVGMCSWNVQLECAQLECV